MHFKSSAASNIHSSARTAQASIGVLLALVIGACGGSQDENAGVVEAELHGTTLLSGASPTICWVKDDESTTSDVAFDAATLVAQKVVDAWDAASGLQFTWLGRCGAPVSGVYPGTIRILWNELKRDTGFKIPGCSSTHPNTNWGGYPGRISNTCRWNASFATSQPINNYLHEAGHTLGFLHEHQRTDNTDSACGSSAPDDNQNLVTAYDVMSVMHYSYGGTCIAAGNRGNTGLSDLDQLGAEVAYPKNAEAPIALLGAMAYGGGQVFRSDVGGSLQPGWSARGALPGVFANFSWTVGSSVTVGLLRSIPGDVGGTPVLATMRFTDPWGRSRSGSTQISTSSSKHTAVVVASFSQLI